MTKLQEAFSLREAAEILGVNPTTIRRLIHKKVLRAGKVGRDYRLSKVDLNAYYQSQGGGKLFEDIEAETTETPPAPKPQRKKKAREGT